MYHLRNELASRVGVIDGQPINVTAGQNLVLGTPGQVANDPATAGGGTATTGGAGAGISGAQALAATTAALSTLLADPVTPKNAEAWKAEIEKCREQLAQVQRNIEAENARRIIAQNTILQEAQRLENEGIHLGFRQGELSTIHQRRHQSRLIAGLGQLQPRALFQTP